MRVLLIDPSYCRDIFGASKVRAAVAPKPALGLAAVAGVLRRDGVEVRILGLNLAEDAQEAIANSLEEFRPNYVGVTFTTPLSQQAGEIAHLVKQFDSRIIVVGGGPHATVLPEETLRQSEMDAVVVGEGDFTLSEVIEKGTFKGVAGVYYKADAQIVGNGQRPDIPSLDTLPYSALDLFDVKRDVHPRLMARRNPVAAMETSRGCFAQCSFCNKAVFSYRYRTKGVKRTVDEMEYLLGLGYREIHFVDDGFTTNMKRAAEIAQEIVNRGLDFTWYPRGGLRVDHVSLELLKIMRAAGCYRVPYGIESGSPEILSRVGKHITLDQVRHAVDWAHEAGMEVEGCFMIGLPGETIRHMEKTIRFASSLDLDYAKFDITVPLPGTPMFTEMDEKGQLKTKDWSKYTFSTSPRELYDHEYLDWATLDHYYSQSHRRFYLRPQYILRRAMRSIRSGQLLSDIKYFFQTPW